MTATNHGIFGSVIAITLQRYPAVAIALSPFSHFLLDMIPHFGAKESDLKSTKFYLVLVLDAALAVVTTLAIAWVWSDIALLVVACAFLAASPDLMWIYYEYINPKLKSKHLIPRFHSWIQWSQTETGSMVELAWFAILFPSLMFIGSV